MEESIYLICLEMCCWIPCLNYLLINNQKVFLLFENNFPFEIPFWIFCLLLKLGFILFMENLVDYVYLINPLWNMWLANIFFQSTDYFFLLLALLKLKSSFPGFILFCDTED
jgi:hypothetical protein